MTNLIYFFTFRKPHQISDHILCHITCEDVTQVTFRNRAQLTYLAISDLPYGSLHVYDKQCLLQWISCNERDTPSSQEKDHE